MTRIFFRHKYSAIALPSLDVTPVRNTSPTFGGISFRMTAAVRVLPWTTRTFRFGCLLTNNVPPPLSASFCKHDLNLEMYSVWLLALSAKKMK
jgi:hypothetical protein